MIHHKSLFATILFLIFVLNCHDYRITKVEASSLIANQHLNHTAVAEEDAYSSFNSLRDERKPQPLHKDDTSNIQWPTRTTPQQFKNQKRRELRSQLRGSSKSTPTSAPTFMAMEELKTFMGGDNVSYGNMFDIVTRKRLTVMTFDIHTDGYSVGGGGGIVKVEVWTRRGTFVGHHTSSEGWMKLASTEILAVGVGKYSRIPFEDFDEVTIEKGERQAFFVTLKTPDLRYSKIIGVNVGDIFESNDDLQFMIGTAMGQSGFGPRIFDNRVWNGRIHYTTSAYLGVTTTTVPFVFSVERSESVTNKDIINSIDGEITNYLTRKLNQDQGDYDGLGLKFDWVQSSALLTSKSNVMACDLQGTSDTTFCSIINSAVHITHGNNIKGAFVRNKILMLGRDMLSGLTYKNRFVGRKSLKTDNMIGLTGVNETTFSQKNLIIFQDTLKVFLNRTLAEYSPPIEITLVSVDFSDVTQVSLHRQRLHEAAQKTFVQQQRAAKDEETASPTTTVVLHVTIIGEYQPPPDVPFKIIVREALANHVSKFLEYLKLTDDFKDIDITHFGSLVIPSGTDPTTEEESHDTDIALSPTPAITNKKNKNPSIGENINDESKAIKDDPNGYRVFSDQNNASVSNDIQKETSKTFSGGVNSSGYIVIEHDDNDTHIPPCHNKTNCTDDEPIDEPIPQVIVVISKLAIIACIAVGLLIILVSCNCLFNYMLEKK